MSNLRDSFRAAVMTALFTFLGTAGAALIGLLDEVSSWVNDGVEPDWSATGQIVLSAVIAGVSGLVNWAVREVQAQTGKGSVPHYESTK